MGANPGSDLLTDKEVSALLGVTVAALAQWRHRGQGPAFVREGRWIRYRRSDVDAWVSHCADLTRARTMAHAERKASADAARAKNAERARAAIPVERRSEFAKKAAAVRWAAKGA